jgi:hypothetical protein
MNYPTAIVVSALMLAGASALADETRMGKMPKSAIKAAVGEMTAPGKESVPSRAAALPPLAALMKCVC